SGGSTSTRRRPAGRERPPRLPPAPIHHVKGDRGLSVSDALRGPVLVTGAAGFIGAHLVRELAGIPGVEVVALDDRSGGFRENVPEEVRFVEGSVTDPALVERLFDEYAFRH